MKPESDQKVEDIEVFPTRKVFSFGIISLSKKCASPFDRETPKRNSLNKNFWSLLIALVGPTNVDCRLFLANALKMQNVFLSRYLVLF